MINLGKELHDKFLKELKIRIPERGKLASYLIDILYIEKEAVYRRLRGEVPFTFAEVVIIAKRLHISIDNFTDIVPLYKGHSFRMYGYNFFNMTDADYAISREYNSIIKAAIDSPNSEFGVVASIVPLHFSIYYKHIFRLYMLRWMYPFDDPGLTLPYSKILIPDKLQEYHNEYLRLVQEIKHTYFVWDNLLMLYIVNDISYFNSIQLITDEEVVAIKKELGLFLDDLEKLAYKGAYDTGNEVEIYVSNVNFEATYTYLHAENVNLSMITTFSLSAVTSLEKEACAKMRTWIHSLKRTSTLISKCSEVDRALFFKKQRSFLSKI